MKKVYVALVTPFLSDGQIDFDALYKIITTLIEEGCDGFVVCGTTGESSTLSEEEKFSILHFVCELCKDKVEIYFGCGSNNTSETLRLCKKAQNYPIDGVMLVTPYYNKPTQKGLLAHYTCIANNCTHKIMLYEVESRCGCHFEVDTLYELIRMCPSIKSLKIATNNIDRVKEICNKIPTLDVLCGSDDKIKEFDMVGAKGLVSVIGHIEMDKLKAFYKYGIDYDAYFKKISSAIFYEINPIGIKYAMKYKYMMNDIVRLPLVSIDNEHKKRIDTFYDNITQ